MGVIEQMAMADPELREIRLASRRFWVERSEERIIQWQAEGLARPEVDAHYAANALGAMVDRCAFLWLVLGEDYDEDRAVASLTDLYANALGLPVPGRTAEPSTGAREQPRLPVTGDAEADALLVDDPFALLVGMLVDQQFPLERAFAAPALLRRRLGADHFSATALAALDPAEVEARLRRAPGPAPLPGGHGRRGPVRWPVTWSPDTTAGPRMSGSRSPTPSSSTAGCGRCPASATRSPRSSSPCSASGWACALEDGSA